MTAPHTPGHGHDPHAKNDHDGHGHHDDHSTESPQDLDDNEFTRPRDLDAADEHPHAHLEDLTYLEKDKLLFKENLGFQFYNVDHKKAGREVGDKKWDDYIKDLNNIFARYTNGIDGLEKDKKKNLETKPPKPTNELEQKIDNQVREAIREGWTKKDFVLYVNGVHYDLYRFGIEGLKKLRGQLAENFDAVQKIDQLSKLKKAALVRAVQGAVGNVLETYGWRHPTEKESEQIETFKKLIDDEKNDLLIAEIKNLAIEAGVAVKHIITVLYTENLVLKLKALKVTDDQIKKTALEKLRKLNDQTYWESIKNQASAALESVFPTSSETMRRVEAELAGIPYEESERLRNLVIEYNNNPGTTALAKTIKDMADAGSEPEKWLFVEEFVEANDEIKRDIDLTPKARTYKKMIMGWGVDFKSFTQILPRRTPKPEPHTEHHAHELTSGQKQFAQEIVMLFKIKHHDEIIKRCLNSFSNFLYDLVGNPDSVAATEVAKIFTASFPRGNYDEFIAVLPSHQKQAEVARLRNEAEHDTRHKKNHEAVNLVIDFIAGKELPSAKIRLNNWVKQNKDQISSLIYNTIDNLTKPPADPKPPSSPTPVKTPVSRPATPAEPRHLTLVPNPDLIAAEKAIETKLAEKVAADTSKSATPSIGAYNSLKEAEDAIAHALAHKETPVTTKPLLPTGETRQPRVSTDPDATNAIVEEDIEDEETIGTDSIKLPPEPATPTSSGTSTEKTTPPEPVKTTPSNPTNEANTASDIVAPGPEVESVKYSNERITDELVRTDIFLTSDTPNKEKERLLASKDVIVIQEASGRTITEFKNNLPTAGKYLAKKLEIAANKFRSTLTPEKLTDAELGENLKKILWQRTRIAGAKDLSDAQKKFDAAIAELGALGVLLKTAESAPTQERVTGDGRGNVDIELQRNNVPGMLSENGYKIAIEAFTSADGSNNFDQDLLRQLYFILAGKDKDDFELLEEYATVNKNEFSEKLKPELGLIIKETKTEILS